MDPLSQWTEPLTALRRDALSEHALLDADGTCVLDLETSHVYPDVVVAHVTSGGRGQRSNFAAGFPEPAVYATKKGSVP